MNKNNHIDNTDKLKMTYTIEKEDLITILHINNINCYSGCNQDPIESFDESLKQSFMDSAIKLQPELEKINHFFMKEARDLDSLKKHSIQTGHALIELFAKVFDGEIKMTSFNKSLFTSCRHVRPVDRKNLFLRLNKKSEEFLPMLYEEIEKNKNDDLCLYESYFQILRINKNNLSGFSNEDLLKSINSIDTFFDVNLSKKKISTYTSLFDKNQFLYDFVMKDMGDLFKKSAVLNNYWESKLIEFEKNIVLKNEGTISKFKEEQSFFYSFEINKEWVIKEQKISEKQARLFCIAFKRVLTSFLDDSFNIDFVNKNIDDFSIGLTTNTENDSNLIKNLFNNLVKYMPELFKIFDHASDLPSQLKQMENYVSNLNKYIMSENLNNELEIKTPKLNNLKI